MTPKLKHSLKSSKLNVPVWRGLGCSETPSRRAAPPAHSSASCWCYRPPVVSERSGLHLQLGRHFLTDRAGPPHTGGRRKLWPGLADVCSAPDGTKQEVVLKAEQVGSLVNYIYNAEQRGRREMGLEGKLPELGSGWLWTPSSPPTHCSCQSAQCGTQCLQTSSWQEADSRRCSQEARVAGGGCQRGLRPSPSWQKGPNRNTKHRKQR